MIEFIQIEKLRATSGGSGTVPAMTIAHPTLIAQANNSITNLTRFDL
jgi:hypothetical protein